MGALFVLLILILILISLVVFIAKIIIRSLIGKTLLMGYLGGHPEYSNGFSCGLMADENKIIICKGTSTKPVFHILKSDIVNIKIQRGVTRNIPKNRDVIILKIKYNGSEIELYFRSLMIQRTYNKMTALIYKKDNNEVLVNR